jgi:hypothetical protein
LLLGDTYGAKIKLLALSGDRLSRATIFSRFSTSIWPELFSPTSALSAH